MKINIVGQDPSFRNWGLVAASVDIFDFSIEIKDMFVSQESKESKQDRNRKKVRQANQDLDRARRLHKEVTEFIGDHNAKFSMIELPHGGEGLRSMKTNGMCVGIISSLQTAGHRTITISERENKMHSLGKASATKDEMIEWAMNRYPNAPWKMRNLKGQLVGVKAFNEHVADAVSALEAGIYHDDFVNAVEVARQLTA